VRRCRADFHYDVDPDLDSESPTATVPQESVTLSVSNPTQYGSGLARHTRYCVASQTTLAHFPRKGEQPTCASRAVLPRQSRTGKSNGRARAADVSSARGVLFFGQLDRASRRFGDVDCILLPHLFPPTSPLAARRLRAHPQT